MKFTKKEQSLVPTKELLNEIQKSIACKQPEQLVMLGSSDGKHIDTVFFVDKSKSTQTSCEPDIEVCNKKIREWYEKDIAFCGFAHSHPGAYSQLSDADIEYADRIMEAFDMESIELPIIILDPRYPEANHRFHRTYFLKFRTRFPSMSFRNLLSSKLAAVVLLGLQKRWRDVV